MTPTAPTLTLGGRFKIHDADDIEALVDVADEFGCSLACLIAAAEGDGEPLSLGEEE